MTVNQLDSEFIVQRDALVADIKRRSDTYMNYVLGGYFITGLVLAFYYNTFESALFVGGNAIMVYYVVKIALPDSALYQYLLSAVLGVFVVQFTYQMHGMVEMGFFAFIGSAILITYRNWKLQIPILLVILMHHSILAELMQYRYDDIYAAPMRGLALHFFVIQRLLTATIFFICGLWTYHFQQSEENQIAQNIQLRKLQQEIVLNEERDRTREQLEAYNNQLIAANQRLEISQKNADEARVEAENANKAKSIFMSNMSHELRTPLSGIIGMAQLMDEDMLTGTGKSQLHLIRDSGEHLLAIIDDILNYADAETGKMQLENSAFDLYACVKEVMELFAAKAREKSIGLTYYIANNVPVEINADRLRLRQVLINLTNNALKFTAKGEVFLKVCLQRKKGSKTTGLQFDITDTGTGIPDHQLKYLFKPFSQCDQELNRKFGGTGLGLVIAGNIVKLMGGEIEVQSTAGKGSCFTFTVPITSEMGECVVRKMTPVDNVINMVPGKDFSKRFPMRILVAEDNEVNAMMITRLLANLGYNVKVAKNGREAVDDAGDSAYDLILMDLQMPEMDGLEATREIRQTLLRQPRIIAVTANALTSDRDSCINAGMNDYMTKPINMNILLEMLERWAPKKNEYAGNLKQP